MNLADFDIFPLRIRKLQEDHAAGHRALVNWGLYSRDRYKIGPKGTVSPKSFEKATSGLPEGYAEESDVALDDGIEAKAEMGYREPYNEQEAAILCERIHGPGGLSDTVRDCLAMVYIQIYVLPEKYPGYSGCTPDAFCARLEEGLLFVERFN